MNQPAVRERKSPDHARDNLRGTLMVAKVAIADDDPETLDLRLGG